ncbi:MAG TPA: Gfo/Idh/MocA family oxidoreductase [Chitinophagaceae bacterium]|nr:Gfo/Idh/MocA family oxidoreductase [Chitinophagaceae bacterium]MCC6636052.1 Gfo/Idh/MocA family oxidoreductase [Chitinophagaceae bacterium]HMZ45221.1 Gfo/Idh/MocA family oxidoreductase [Chitinophagaceae bacterium]HNJ57920.1 Gfo/Idh/MocA family oxidoreductase [Chitinophagaceae bacterium]HNM33949.1 Gfo/Idh/MocA family oxidoreductase [Chitinophagaceae bacterium]
MDKIKFALIGCGRIAQRHAEHINKLGILKAVCDTVEEKAKALAEKYNVPYYTNFEEMLLKEKEVDVVSICTPNGLHATHAIAALNANFHTLVEKPMALSVYDCGEMIKAAEKANKRLFAIKQNRFNPPVVAVKEAIDNNILGKIYNIQLSCFWNRNKDYYENSWKGTHDLDGGTLYTQFSHFIDLLYWMIGDVKRAYALTSNFSHQGIIDFEDTGVIALEFYNGAIGTINYTVNSYQKNMEGSLTIFAEKGTVKIGGQYLNELEYQAIENFEIKDLPTGNTANNYGTYVGSMSNHDKVYENLIDVLQNGKSIATNSFEGLKTVEIISKIYQSAKELNK